MDLLHLYMPAVMRGLTLTGASRVNPIDSHEVLLAYDNERFNRKVHVLVL